MASVRLLKVPAINAVKLPFLLAYTRCPELLNQSSCTSSSFCAYVSGSANRQEFLERALEWVSKSKIEDYMAVHRKDDNI